MREEDFWWEKVSSKKFGRNLTCIFINMYIIICAFESAETVPGHQQLQEGPAEKHRRLDRSPFRAACAGRPGEDACEWGQIRPIRRRTKGGTS